jgi:NADPH:quinone reductase-like Zn-dependent oxidoreductase
MNLMNAATYKKFGDAEVFELEEVEMPSPKENEVLVKIHATSVNAIDIIARSGVKALFGMTRLMFGFKTPKRKILGFDVSGEVEAVGSKTTKFKTGDLVYGAKQEGGANAEYICLPEKNLALKPQNMSHQEAAAVPDTACTALAGLKYAVEILPGQKVLLYGASGGVGSYAIQIARLFTTEVTAVCSTDKMNLALDLGAKVVIDYTKEDFWTNGQTYDFIFDIVGRKIISYDRCKNSLSPKGVFITTDAETVIFKQIWNKRIKTFMAAVTTESLDYLRIQIEAGKIHTIIDKIFPLNNIVEAHKYYEKGHLKGKIVVNILE